MEVLVDIGNQFSKNYWKSLNHRSIKVEKLNFFKYSKGFFYDFLILKIPYNFLQHFLFFTCISSLFLCTTAVAAYLIPLYKISLLKYYFNFIIWISMKNLINFTLYLISKLVQFKDRTSFMEKIIFKCGNLKNTRIFKFCIRTHIFFNFFFFHFWNKFEMSVRILPCPSRFDFAKKKTVMFPRLMTSFFRFWIQGFYSNTYESKWI